MTETSYIAPHKRALHQAGLKTLLIVQFLTVLPFMGYLPKWLLIVFGLVVFWRWRVLRGQFQKPPKKLVFAALSLGIVVLLASGLNRYSLDSAVAFCLLGYLLKSLEVLRRRDGIFQVYLGYFLAGVFLLYRFDPLAGLTMIALLFFNTLALQAVTSGSHFYWSYAFKQSAIILLGAIPVMVVGYLFFPRIPPLWNIPNEQRGASTGMTDEMTPGSIADLAQSADPAFRISFEDQLPPRDQWYWRGATMSKFDGNTWKAKYSTNARLSWPTRAVLPEPQGDSYLYSVIMENSGRRWLYFLDWPTQIVAKGSVVLPDGRAAKRTTMSSTYQYRARSNTQVTWSNESEIIEENLELPAQGNEQLRQWAVARRAEYNDDNSFIASVLQHIRAEEFYYTLQPPLYSGEQSLSDFWFGRRSGFCSHYASAFAFILRSSGISTRLVSGYMGGSYNDNGGYIQVRQMEAHVWVEAWLNNQWQRFDPTVAVAPERVEVNLDTLLSRSQPGELPLFTRVGQLSLLHNMSMFWDSVQYKWQVFILNYDNDQAIGWFESKFGRFSPLKVAIAVLSLMGSVAFVLAVSLGVIQIPRRQKEPFRSLSKLERWYGQREKHETIRRYFERIIRENPHHQALIPLAEFVERALYLSTASNENHHISSNMKDLQQQRAQ